MSWLAQAGARSTAPPGGAMAKASRAACSIESARRTGTRPSKTSSTSGAASPLATTPASDGIPAAGVVAIGEAAPEVLEVFDGRVPVRRADSIEQAAREAFAMAPPGGAVLLTPACASQDMFRDYAERGERFAAAARALADRAAGNGSAGDHGGRGDAGGETSEGVARGIG